MDDGRTGTKQDAPGLVVKGGGEGMAKGLVHS